MSISLHQVPSIVYPEKVIKRDRREVTFDADKITYALTRCFDNIQKTPNDSFEHLTNTIVKILAMKYGTTVGVEAIQDTVEFALMATGEFEAAKNYVLYRARHAKMRDERPVPSDVKEMFDSSKAYFPTALQQFQFYDKYSRFDYSLGRRETWVETVTRTVDFLYELSQGRLEPEDYVRIQQGILNMKVMPSMRLLAMAGPAARRDNTTIYNCSYMPVSDLRSFSEALWISMSGCGVGYSVESKYVENLPRIIRQKDKPPISITVEDSQPGWCDAFLQALELWFNGYDCVFDLSQLRPAGAVLHTKGGRSSGPESFRVMLGLARNKILSRQGSFLRPLDAHDIMCSIGQAAVSGGVRRTALISLFDYDDMEMRLCKSGDFETHNSQRWNANNSAVLPMSQMTQRDMMKYVLDMYDSERGEPGIFSREVANALIPMRRQPADFGTNPCGEINLRPYEFCNLSVVVARVDDTRESLCEKVELATLIGTIQSLATYFPGLRDEWKLNAEDERLLGVDINGQMDSPIAQDASVQRWLRQRALVANQNTALRLGIKPSAAITCVKPSGNSSQLLNCSSGLHARWSEYYIRNVRVNVHSPVFKVLKDAGVPMDPENGQTWENATTAVIHFPVKSPDGAITRKDRTAIEQCNYWLQVKENWTEHNPSVTITYRPHEEMEVMKWIWDNRYKIGGMAFLPAFDAEYAQLPYIEITKEEYERRAAEFPDIDFSKLWRYEETDYTTAAQEVACLSGTCDV